MAPEVRAFIITASGQLLVVYI